MILGHALLGGKITKQRILLMIFATQGRSLLRVERFRGSIDHITIYWQDQLSPFSATC